MRSILSALVLLLALVGQAFGVAATTTLNYKVGATPIGTNTQAAINATENVVVVQVTPGHPVTVEFAGSAAWSYRSTTATSTTDKPIAASTPYRMRFTETTTFYHVRQVGDGTLCCTPLLIE